MICYHFGKNSKQFKVKHIICFNNPTPKNLPSFVFTQKPVQKQIYQLCLKIPKTDKHLNIHKLMNNKLLYIHTMEYYLVTK